jgi:serine/threonine-protein kinase RsbT
VRLLFVDEGPGIGDIAQAMQDGYTSGSGLGLGLGVAKLLVGEFEVRPREPRGTFVRIVTWR